MGMEVGLVDVDGMDGCVSCPFLNPLAVPVWHPQDRR